MSDATKAVFLSYASQDAEAAKCIANALRAAGVEVWFDAEGGLEHGDEWDAKIRRQIKECVLFLPVVSANTQAREEGYFRLEWDMAAERARSIASGVAFILPVVIDDTKEPAALVPDRFRSVQWTRLPGGAVPPEVLQRFLKLWSHRTGVLKHEAAPAGQTPASAAESIGRPGAKTYAFLAAAVAVIVAAAYFVLQSRRSPEPGASPVTPAQPVAVVPASSPPAGSRDWPKDPDLKRAITLIDSLEATLEDYRLADEISAHAVDRAPSDPETVTVRARVNSAFVMRNFDFSNERAAAAKRFGERAVQLAPGDPQALYALAVFLHDRAKDYAQAETLARRACELAPDEPRYWRQMVRSVTAQRPAEGLALGEDLIRRFPRDVLCHYELSILYRDQRDWEKFERENDAAIALFPLANAVNWKARAAGLLHGDFAEMRRWIERVPARVRAEERSVISSFIYAALSGDYEFGLKSLQGFAEPWFFDAANYAGPSALPQALLLAQQGKAGLARAQYEVAFAGLARHRAEFPADQTSRRAECWILLGLGRQEEARTQYRTNVEGLSRPYRVFAMTGWWFDLIPLGLLLGERDTAVQLIREAATQPEGRQTIRQRMQVDARMAPFRNDPEILAALAEPKNGAVAMTAAASPPSSDWPQDPELKRAMRLIDSPEAIASDVALAEDIIKPILATRPTDPDATLAMGRVQVYYLVRGFDRSEERFATAKHYAERALALTPDDPGALVVMATYLYRRNVELPRALKLLRQAIALRPMEPLYYRMLDNVLSFMPNVTDAEVITSAKVTAERFPADALVQYELARHYRDAGMLGEAEHYFDVAIKLGPVANAIIARARLMLFVHGDPAGMKAMLDQLPERYHGTDRAVFSQFSYAMVTGQPELGLDALQATPEPWMIDFDYTGPVALLHGELLLQQGKAELARLRFTEAQAELGRHKADLSRNFSTTWLEPWLLMRLGRLDEARSRSAIFFPELARPFRLNLGTNWWFNPVAHNLLLGEHAKALELMREAVTFPEGRVILRNALRLDPRMAPFRDDPEIKALLAEPAAGPRPEDGGQGAISPSFSLPPSAPPEDKSIAVLPFENMSADKDSGYFADGIQEDILTNLAHIRELRVVSRTSVAEYRATTKKIPEIARELGVAYVLEGSVRRAGNKVRVTGQLIRAATEEHVWAEKMDRDLNDIFAIQSELAEKIATSLQAAISPREKSLIEKRPTENTEAYDAYLKARAGRRAGGADALRAEEALLRTAVKLDPDFAAAWADLTIVHADAYNLNLDHSEARLASAKAAIDTAVRLAPEAPEVVRALGELYFHGYRDYARATEQYEKLIRLQPNDPNAYSGLGFVQRRQGRWTDSLANFRKALELDPGDRRVAATGVIQMLSAGRRYAELMAQQRQRAEQGPDDSMAFNLALASFAVDGSTREVAAFFATLPEARANDSGNLALRCAWADVQGDFAAAVRLDERIYSGANARTRQPDNALYSAMLRAARGDVTGARALLGEPLAELKSRGETEPANARVWALRGQIEAVLGHRDEALRCARRAIELVPESIDAYDGPRYSAALAFVQAWTGDKDGALAIYARLLHTPFSDFASGFSSWSTLNPHAMRHSARYAPLHGDPRFEALLNDPKNNAPLF